MAGELNPEQKQRLERLQSLVSEVNKADSLINMNQANDAASRTATAQLLSVIAKALILQIAEGEKLEMRLLPFKHGAS